MHEEIPEDRLDADDPPYYRPPEGSETHEYLMDRRRELNGFLPSRVVRSRRPLSPPADGPFAQFAEGSGRQEVSTTTAFTRLLRDLARDEDFGPRVVPIVPDEARTFGMDGLFKEFEIYASHGQKYEPVDHDLLLSYTEDSDGQILEEGITEAGSMASWIAAATSYANRGVPMVPFYTFYSMFGFQRVGDLIWSAADARARGFLLGATAGRTTLLGEGLQHQDGHSLVLAATVPVCEAYDPAFAYETAAIVRDGSGPHVPEGDLAAGDDVFYYLTLYNENYAMPAQPDGVDDEAITRGLYRFADAPDGADAPSLHPVLGSAQGAAQEAVGRAGRALRRGRRTLERHLLQGAARGGPGGRTLEPSCTPTPNPRSRWSPDCWPTGDGPVVAVTDYMRLVPDQVASWVPRPWRALGTDGFGRSDTREALRRFFEIDAAHVVVATLSGLAEQGAVPHSLVEDAIKRYDIDPDLAPPWTR